MTARNNGRRVPAGHPETRVAARFRFLIASLLALALVFGTSSPARADDAPVDTPVTQAREPESTSVVPFILLGAGGVALATGAGFAIWAKSTANSMHATYDPNQKASLRDAALSRSTAADVIMGAGALLAVSGAVLFLTAPKHASTPTVGIGFGQIVLQWTPAL